MTPSKIEWTDRTWNPTTGCTKVSPGCDHCYAEGIAHRFAGSKAFPNGFDVTLRPERLDAPLRWRKPARVFVNSMSDLFHDDVPDEFITRVWAVMAATPQHTYQVLTKRHGRMRALLNGEEFTAAVTRELWESLDLRPDYLDTLAPPPDYPAPIGHRPWPLSNVWLGVSVEDQKRAELRIPHLLDTPAAVRFLSCEPLLGPVDLTRVQILAPRPPHGPGVWLDALRGHYIGPDDITDDRLDWVIAGGESGPGARPMHPAWARQLRDDCQAASVPFFFKQWGEFTSTSRDGDSWQWRDPAFWMARDGRQADEATALADGGSWVVMHRVGKKAAGRELDGSTWDEFPAVAR